MSLKLFDLKHEHKQHLDKAEAILTVAETAGRELTAGEKHDYEAAMSGATAVGRNIAVIESKNTLTSQFGPNGPIFNGRTQQPNGFGVTPRGSAMNNPALYGAEYAQSLHTFLTSGGKAHGEELVAGADGFGGYYFPGSERYTEQRRANAATYEGTQGGSDAAGGYAISVPTVPQITPLALPDLGIFNATEIARRLRPSLLIA